MKIYFVVLFVLLQPLATCAQSVDSYSDSTCKRLLDKCIKKNRIYPKQKYQKSFFEDFTLTPIPICEVNNDSLFVVSNKYPYLIIISKNEQLIGVISSDDVGNSYIDINFIYNYNGNIKTIWNMMRLLSKNDITLYNMHGVNDNVVFAQINNRIVYLDLNFTDIDNNTPLGIDAFKPYDVDSIPSCGLWPRDAKKNSERNLQYYTIGYD